MQMIPTAGKLGLSGRIAQAQADAVSERTDDVVWDVRANVAMAFYDLYATDGALDVARQTLRLLQDILRTAESMYRVGEGRQTDVLRAQVEIARMIEDTVRMTTMRTGMAARLNALLNRAADANVGSPALPAFPDSMASLNALLDLSQRSRPMVKAAEHEVQAANARASLARREIWPDLSIGVQLGQRGGALGGTDRMGSLMLGASAPVFAKNRQFRMRQEAAAMRQMAEADLAAMRADTRAAVTEAYANLVRARHLGALYRTTIIPQANATVASALAAYRVGTVDFMTLLDDRMTVNRYRQDLFALEADEGKSWSELEMLLARELFNPNAAAEHSAPARDGGE
jgi:outer membrane protein TolC